VHSLNPLIKQITAINTSGRIALCGYFLTGYTSPKKFYSLIKSLDAIDIFEFGIPTDDPFLDGPDISRAHDHVTENIGLNAETALPLLGGLQDIPQPRFVMTYAKEGRELDGFLRLCLLNGIQGVLAPDVPVDEAKNVALIASSMNIAYIGFIHDGMGAEETAKIATLCDIIYLKVSCGKTGQKGELSAETIKRLQDRITELRTINNQLLIGAGIGIQTPEQIQTLAALDINMVVVGTSLMNTITAGVASLQEYTRSLYDATVRPRRFSESPVRQSLLVTI